MKILILKHISIWSAPTVSVLEATQSLHSKIDPHIEIIITKIFQAIHVNHESR